MMKNKILLTSIVLLQVIVGQSQSLQDYLIIAKDNDPTLKSIQYRYESALEKVNEEGSLPSTIFSGGYFVQEPETRVGAQKAKISAMQNLPWFGTLSVRKESARFKAEAVQNEIDLYQRHLFLDIKKAYYSLYELYAMQSIYHENIELLKTYEKIALNYLENNRSSMVDVLKIKIEKNKIQNDLDNNQLEINSKLVSFNILLNREEGAKITIPGSLDIEDTDLIGKENFSQNPKLLQFDNIQNSLLKSEMAAKKESMPVLGVGLDYVFVDEREVADLADNGKDIIMPMVSLSIPVFSKKYSSKRKQLQLDQKAIASSKESTLNRFTMIYENAKSSIDKARSTIQTQEENLIQAEQARKALLSSYQTGRMDFNEILEIQKMKLNFQLTKVNAEKEYAIQLAMIHYLTKEN